MCFFNEHKIKFFISVDGELIDLPASLMVELASNHNGCLSHFLAGYFKSYPTEEELHRADNEPWSLYDK